MNIASGFSGNVTRKLYKFIKKLNSVLSEIKVKTWQENPKKSTQKNVTTWINVTKPQMQTVCNSWICEFSLIKGTHLQHNTSQILENIVMYLQVKTH